MRIMLSEDAMDNPDYHVVADVRDGGGEHQVHDRLDARLAPVSRVP